MRIIVDRLTDKCRIVDEIIVNEERESNPTRTSEDVLVQTLGEISVHIYKLEGIKILHTISKSSRQAIISIVNHHATIFMGFNFDGNVGVSINGMITSQNPYEHVFNNCMGRDTILQIDKNRWEYISIFVDQRKANDFLMDIGNTVIKQFKMSFTKEIFEVTRQIITCKLNGYFRPLYYASKVKELFILQYYQYTHFRCEDKLVSRRDYIILYKAVKLIHEEYLDPIEVSDVCKRVGTNKSKLRTLFKEHFNVTINKYLIKLRMTYAMSILLNNSSTISEVSHLLNYSTPNHFSRAYKNYFGRYPSEIINKQR